MKTKYLYWFCMYLLVASSSAFAEDRYDYCRDKARDISGYYGSIPADYEDEPSAIGSAMKGAASGAALSWLSGGDKKARKKAVKRGAALGLMIGGIKKAEAKEKRRKNREKRRRYEIELNACMLDR